MKFFTIPNSNIVIATLRIVTIERSELTFLLILYFHVFSLYKSAKNKLQRFAINCNIIWPNCILILPSVFEETIESVNSKMSTMTSKILKLADSTKKIKSWEQNIFSSNKNFDYYRTKNSFLVDFTLPATIVCISHFKFFNNNKMLKALRFQTSIGEICYY